MSNLRLKTCRENLKNVPNHFGNFENSAFWGKYNDRNISRLHFLILI